MDDTPRAKKVGRPPKYDWSDKRDICYKLYVEEQKTAADIARYFADHFNVTEKDLPCRKGFLRQFQLWGFAPNKKKLTPEEQDTVLARIKELWQNNVSQKDIKQTLAEEGWELRNYDFSKLWKQNGLRLRSDAGYKPSGDKEKQARKRKRGSEGFMAELEAAAGAQEGRPDGEPSTSNEADELAQPIAPEDAAHQMQRLYELQVESDQKLQSGKRRRRIRGWAHLPPDAPGTEPRYASETSLDECKAFLHLSNEMYQTVRKDFQIVCEDRGIIKKTLCEDGIWEGSKQRLIRENMHLSAMLHPLQPDLDKKANALDCICADVTKRMRVQQKTITIAEANNILRINPAESKAIRRTLYEIFASVDFQSRLVCGEEYFQGLRQRWINENQRLAQALTPSSEYTPDPRANKCVDILCSDTMKRFREDKLKRGLRKMVQPPGGKYGPGPGPAWAGTPPRTKVGKAQKAREAQEQAVQQGQPNELGRWPMQPGQPQATLPGRYPTQVPQQLPPSNYPQQNDMDFDIDPALAVPGPFIQPSPPQQTAPQPAQASTPAYFRLAPGSQVVGNHPRMWLGKLASATMDSLHAAATSKAGAAKVVKISGVVKNEDGTEDSWLIENQDELEVYLVEATEKASFTVVLEGGYA
ncbi:hypothetical protein TI39_contig330g00005 [Zymoseptoria brevis]|uniref:Uncharacterized protein n=1 Tax=Zymoseptoria brevis TaxID=1047168 RepID=A0A0F4GSN9_9PEZI|nr:hypothetical protein TI39_contig330g00005 [Zymoseptoria brevis]